MIYEELKRFNPSIISHTVLAKTDYGIILVLNQLFCGCFIFTFLGHFCGNLFSLTTELDYASKKNVHNVFMDIFAAIHFCKFLLLV